MRSFDKGRRFGSCATRAVRYWSTTFSKHVRLQFSGIGPVDASALGARLPVKTAAAMIAMVAVANRLERMNMFSFTVRIFYLTCSTFFPLLRGGAAAPIELMSRYLKKSARPGEVRHSFRTARHLLCTLPIMAKIDRNSINTPPLKARRRELRNNPTPAEAILWMHLQRRQVLGKKFRRQFSIWSLHRRLFLRRLRHCDRTGRRATFRGTRSGI